MAGELYFEISWKPGYSEVFSGNYRPLSPCSSSERRFGSSLAHVVLQASWSEPKRRPRRSQSDQRGSSACLFSSVATASGRQNRRLAESSGCRRGRKAKLTYLPISAPFTGHVPLNTTNGGNDVVVMIAGMMMPWSGTAQCPPGLQPLGCRRAAVAETPCSRRPRSTSVTLIHLMNMVNFTGNPP